MCGTHNQEEAIRGLEVDNALRRGRGEARVKGDDLRPSVRHVHLLFYKEKIQRGVKSRDLGSREEKGELQVRLVFVALCCVDCHFVR